MNDIPLKFLRKWYVKAAIVFGLSTVSEVLQIFGIYFLRVTFDMLDIFMFGMGVLTAVFIDQQVFKRWMPFVEMDFINKK